MYFAYLLSSIQNCSLCDTTYGKLRRIKQLGKAALENSFQDVLLVLGRPFYESLMPTVLSSSIKTSFLDPMACIFSMTFADVFAAKPMIKLYS